MFDALRRVAPGGDGEVDSRIVEHPFGIVALDHGRLGSEQGRVESDRLVELGDPDVDMRRRFMRTSFQISKGGAAGAQDAPPQQFSIR